MKTFFSDFKWASDERMLKSILSMMTRISISVSLIIDDDGDTIKFYVINLVAGDKIVTSNPIPLPWPVKAVKTEEIIGKDKVN